MLCSSISYFSLGVPRPVSIQNDFSLVDRRFETELAEIANFASQDLDIFLRGFVVSANLRNACRPFCKSKCRSPQVSAKLPQKYRTEKQQNPGSRNPLGGDVLPPERDASRVRATYIYIYIERERERDREREIDVYIYIYIYTCIYIISFSLSLCIYIYI